MIILIGFICSIFSSFFAAGTSIITQKFNVDPPVLALYRGFGLAIALLPFMIFVPAPLDPIFYLLIVVNGLIAAFSFLKATEIIEEHGANITSKFLTVPPVLVAVSWWVINPVKFSEFVMESPEKATVAFICLGGMFFSIFALGKGKYTHKALVSSIPIFLAYTAQTLLCYYAIQRVTLIQGIFYYPFLQGLIIGGLNYFIHVHHLHDHIKDKLLKTVFDREVLKAGSLLVLVMVMVRITSNVALKTLPNPSYISLISNLQIIWVYLASQRMHLKNIISPKKGIILVIYAITFILMTY